MSLTSAPPSPSLEKGSYRLRKPSRNTSFPKSPLDANFGEDVNGSLKLTRSEPVALSPTVRLERYVGLLICLLVLATFSCFGAAYYLYKTRWDAQYSYSSFIFAGWTVSDSRSSLAPVSLAGSTAGPPNDTVNSTLLPSHSNDFAALKALDLISIDSQRTTSTLDATEKYLTYLPHSGFHNQRIAFENALVLARVLNRTLFVPPVWLGQAKFGYAPYETLQTSVQEYSKGNLSHCRELQNAEVEDISCEGYHDYTLLSWDWLVDLSALSALLKTHRMVQRWDMSEEWLFGALNITQSNREDDVYTLMDTSPYHFRIVDLHPKKTPGPRYLESLAIADLMRLPHRLLQFGTLFGSSRLRLRDAFNLSIRTEVRRSMALSNPILHRVAELIKDALGGAGYIAAHVRVGDGIFEQEATRNVRLIWWKVLLEVLNVDEELVQNVEASVMDGERKGKPEFPFDVASLQPHPPLPPLLIPPNAPKLACRSPLHTSPSLQVLNTPLFISTDAPSPSTSPLFRLFFATFPCTFTLHDFSPFLEPLERLENEYDGVKLKRFVVPMMDAIVAAKAREVVGTPGSTFSQYVEDVLWRRFNGWEIVQRG